MIDALLTHGDFRASLALLVTWLSEADTVPLQDPSASFFRLTFRWLREVVAADLPAGERAPLIRRFFELLEANAEERWDVPSLFGGPGGEIPFGDDDTTDSDLDDEDDFDGEEGDDDDEDEDDDEDDDDSPYASAYEGVSYKDSADDGEEDEVANGSGGPGPGDFVLDGEAEGAEEQLRFLAGVARLWRTAAQPTLWTAPTPPRWPPSATGSARPARTWRNCSTWPTTCTASPCPRRRRASRG